VTASREFSTFPLRVDQVLAQLLKKLMAHNRREAVTNLLGLSNVMAGDCI